MKSFVKYFLRNGSIKPQNTGLKKHLSVTMGIILPKALLFYKE